jgi:hypothetical protein
VKYESWLKINQQYKYNLISKLTSKQYNNFVYQFFNNKEQTIYILSKKLNHLFDSNKLRLYSNSDLIKINKIVTNSKLSLNVIITLFDKFKRTNITEYNVNKLLLYLRDIDKFNNLNIKWGPGNHKNITKNINQHFNKHILSDEGKYWVKILDTCNSKSYEQYAIKSFNKMKNIIIHTDGVNVYLSGFYNNIFTIGRYDNDIFGISSCYYVETGQKSGRYKGLCLEL